MGCHEVGEMYAEERRCSPVLGFMCAPLLRVQIKTAMGELERMAQVQETYQV